MRIWLFPDFSALRVVIAHVFSWVVFTTETSHQNTAFLNPRDVHIQICKHAGSQTAFLIPTLYKKINNKHWNPNNANRECIMEKAENNLRAYLAALLAATFFSTSVLRVVLHGSKSGQAKSLVCYVDANFIAHENMASRVKQSSLEPATPKL
jgi:hypothetical protein